MNRAQGMVIRYEVLVNESGQIFTTPTNEIDINSFGLPPGMYFVQVAMRACITVMTHTHAHTNKQTHVYIKEWYSLPANKAAVAM